MKTLLELCIIAVKPCGNKDARTKDIVLRLGLFPLELVEQCDIDMLLNRIKEISEYRRAMVEAGYSSELSNALLCQIRGVRGIERLPGESAIESILNYHGMFVYNADSWELVAAVDCFVMASRRGYLIVDFGGYQIELSEMDILVSHYCHSNTSEILCCQNDARYRTLRALPIIAIVATRYNHSAGSKWNIDYISPILQKYFPSVQSIYTSDVFHNKILQE